MISTDWQFEAIGTRWEITTPDRLPVEVSAAVGAEIDRIDAYWSRFRSDSVVAQMSRTAGIYPVAPMDRVLLDWYRTLYEITGGAVTPLVGATLADAGYDAQYSLRPADSIRPVPRWDDVIYWDGTELTVKEPILLDVGAAGKGFAIDRVAAILQHAGVGEFIVDAGGDMVISPREVPVRIALEHPGDPTKAIGVITSTGGAICASAPNRRAWGSWHHIVDPRSGAPAHEVLATWAMAADAMTADGLATALFFTPAPTLRSGVGGVAHSAGSAQTTLPTEITWTGPAPAIALAEAGFHHVTIRRGGGVEHTSIPGLELYL